MIWVILACYQQSPCGFGPPDYVMPRNYQTAIIQHWTEELSSETATAAVNALQGRGFASRSRCMTELKRALPEVDLPRRRGVTSSVEHGSTYVFEMNFTASYHGVFFTCFSKPTPVS